MGARTPTEGVHRVGFILRRTWSLANPWGGILDGRAER